ncbi:hypothetical protein CVT24_000273 [Panaeolus cyanescens]|uniref:F-box domain-containing protein n=1 Tax=Panaeolus cyanescens TaxID=181874 RepID=A0A409YD85_9AGAR|nr:hypothetical protein CVT24_000273 [Panaeolus cyanescens]
MSKRELSPSALPPPKRAHTTNNRGTIRSLPLNFDNSLYDELILCIFSHLSWVDLCMTQSTSRNWARLAADNELWRHIFIKVYGRTRLRGAKGFIGRLDGREIMPMPGRVTKSEPVKNWKWMFRISSNWRKGMVQIFYCRCAVEEFKGDLHNTHEDPNSSSSSATSHDQTHVVLVGPLTITASTALTTAPFLQLTTVNGDNHIIPLDKPQNQPVAVSTLALDQSPPVSSHISLVACMSTGDFHIIKVNPSSPALFSRVLGYRPPQRSSRALPIIRAAFYHPLLVTLASDFTLSLFDLSDGAVQRTQTLTSFSSYPPASLVLSSPSPTAFKLVLAYAVPVYPRHWSVGAAELIIARTSQPWTSQHSLTSSFKEDYIHGSSSHLTVVSSRAIRAFEVPSGWIDENSLRTMREQWGRKLCSVADVQTDGKWVVLAPGDEFLSDEHSVSSGSASPINGSSTPMELRLHSPTALQLYRLVLPSHSSSVSASPPKLNFVRTLHGQTSPISAIALSDGRCVSLGQNGSIWVWDLEGGTGAEVAPADDFVIEHKMQAGRGTVAFDERRIVSAHAGRVVIRRFDI